MAQSKEDADVRRAVRERYGKIAEKVHPIPLATALEEAGCNCCSPGTQESAPIPAQVSALYETPDVESLPVEVTALSLGCGDPVTLAGLQPGQTVVDLGSGGGIDCFLAARQVGLAGKVIGVDMTPSMIERARENRDRLQADNVEFRLGEIEHLPVGDSVADVILSNCVINLSPDKTQVLGEAHRVLKPGGLLAVTDIVTTGPLPESLRADLAAWTGCVAGALAVDDYVAILQEVGFEDIKVERVHFDSGTAEALVLSTESGMTRTGELALDLRDMVFSARISARKPAVDTPSSSIQP